MSKGTNRAQGTVSVSFAINAPPEKVWSALTEPLQVGKWFGSLTPEFQQSGRAKLDFGDGDFFAIQDIQMSPPFLLRYNWRFLGIGPMDTIEWRVERRKSGSLVTVNDSEPERTSEWTQELKTGWLDFTQRLERFLRTGESCRYDWSREIQANIEISSRPQRAWERLFGADASADWLPFEGSAVREGAILRMKGQSDPGMIELEEIIRSAPHRMIIRLSCEQWLNPTTCFLELSERPQGALLSIRHTGWEAISLESGIQFDQRKRFCALWIEALQIARQLTEESGSGAV